MLAGIDEAATIDDVVEGAAVVGAVVRGDVTEITVVIIAVVVDSTWRAASPHPAATALTTATNATNLRFTMQPYGVGDEPQQRQRSRPHEHVRPS